MKVVIGLGNPGKIYQFTRHNVGQSVVGSLVDQDKWKVSKSAQAKLAFNDQQDVLFAISTTYMNQSGKVLTYLKKKYPQLQNTDLFVVHDDLDIPIGEFKIQFGKGPHEHNGLLSLYQAWGSSSFWHVRIGIDGRKGNRDLAGQQYVLQPFTAQEKTMINQLNLTLIPQLKLKLDSMVDPKTN